jgi:inosose dehydratase
MADPQYVEGAIRDLAGLRYYGIELFGNQIEAMEARGGVGTLLDKYNLWLISVLRNESVRPRAAKERDRQDAGMGGAGEEVQRENHRRRTERGETQQLRFQGAQGRYYRHAERTRKSRYRYGLTAVLHQHTGACVESREETYAAMETVDARVMKFGPDIGQLQKGGSDPVQVVKDFLPVVQHMPLKDYSGGTNCLGYCLLGEGKMDSPAILSMMGGRKIAGMIMLELDSPPPQPVPALETAKIAKAYLEKRGITFRS